MSIYILNDQLLHSPKIFRGSRWDFIMKRPKKNILKLLQRDNWLTVNHMSNTNITFAKKYPSYEESNLDFELAEFSDEAKKIIQHAYDQHHIIYPPWWKFWAKSPSEIPFELKILEIKGNELFLLEATGEKISYYQGSHCIPTIHLFMLFLNYLDREKEKMDKSYFPSFSPERNKLHQKILTDFFFEYKHNIDLKKKAIFLSGAFGSGKSHYIRQNLGLFSKFIYIDPDEFRHQLPEYDLLVEKDPLSVGEKTHKEVTYLSLLCERIAILMGLNYICDGSLSNIEWYSSWFPYLKSQDYTIEIIRLECPMELAWERCENRSKQVGRRIPRFIWEETYKKSREAYKVLSEFVDSSKIIYS